LSGNSSTSIRVLIVDHNQFMRKQVRTVLSLQAGFEVVCESSDGFDAIRKAQEFQPDVVLLDISLPQINGLQAAPLIKKFAPNTELLFVTLHDNPLFVREAFAVGARGFLVKTDVPSTLREAVQVVHMKRRFVSKELEHVLSEEPIVQLRRPRNIA
jgi:DNA-binding NarL/FixJ family response regulator